VPQRASKLTVNVAPEPVKKGKTITFTGGALKTTVTAPVDGTLR
jgi:hypothetical protein